MKLIMIIICFGGGILTSAGFFAFLCMIGLIPRLTRITGTQKHLLAYGDLLALGITLFNLLSLYSANLSFIGQGAGRILVDAIMFTFGIFSGCIAAAITEALNVIPIFSERFAIKKYLLLVVRAWALGKCLGSMIQLYQ